MLGEISAFAALAVGAHLALWGALSGGGAPEGAGDGGQAIVSLEAMPGAAADLVSAWRVPPDVRTSLSAVPPPRPQASPPVPIEQNDPQGAVPASTLSQPGSVDAPPVPEKTARPILPLPTPAEAPEAPRGTSTQEAALPTQPPAASEGVASQRVAALSPPETAAPPMADVAPPMAFVRPPPRPAQRAAGAGQGTARGASGEAAASGLSEGARISLVAAWGAEIRARIEARKEHPTGVNATGRPVLRITVARDGSVEAVRVLKGSRVAALDEAAVRAVRRAGRFPPAPERLDLARVSFDLPISFTR